MSASAVASPATPVLGTVSTNAQTKTTPKPRPGTQKRLFNSISRFLSGGKARPKLARAASAPRGDGAHVAPPVGQESSVDDVPLEDVVREGASTRSARPNSVSTEGSGLVQDAARHDAASTISGADTDASIRPITPISVAPSAISHSHSASTSTNASVARTFKSYASTKPTTLLSVDSGGGANRIAVAPAGMSHSTSTAGGGLPAISSSSPSGISFSALPSTPTSPSSPSLSSPLANAQVPHHTIAHPRNNPHPLSPAQDNASMLTLASSSFAPSIFLSGSRTGPTSLLRTRQSEFADEDASVRALAPSRRASDESLGSRSTWSAAIPRGESVRDRLNDGTASVRTVATGGTGGGVGDETEAQKVVRDADDAEQGGAKGVQQMHSDRPSSSSSSALHPDSAHDQSASPAAPTPHPDRGGVDNSAPQSPILESDSEDLPAGGKTPTKGGEDDAKVSLPAPKEPMHRANNDDQRSLVSRAETDVDQQSFVDAQSTGHTSAEDLRGAL